MSYRTIMRKNEWSTPDRVIKSLFVDKEFSLLLVRVIMRNIPKK